MSNKHKIQGVKKTMISILDCMKAKNRKLCKIKHKKCFFSNKITRGLKIFDEQFNLLSDLGLNRN